MTSAATGTIDAAVIGLGDFGRRHIAAARGRDGVRIVGVADRDAELARATAAVAGVPSWSADAVAMLTDLRPQVVCVAASSDAHVELAEAAVGLGAAVLVEKPIALDPAGRRRMTELAERGIVVPGHVLRFSPPYVAVAARLARGQLGELVSLSAERHRGVDHRRSYPDGDPVSMTMVHDIDLVLWLGGERIVEVTAAGTEAAAGTPTVVAQLRTQGGRAHQVRTTWALPAGAGEDRLLAYGTKGVDRVEVRDGDGLQRALEGEWDEVLASVREGRPSEVVTVADAVHGLEVVEAIRASIASGGRSVAVSRP